MKKPESLIKCHLIIETNVIASFLWHCSCCHNLNRKNILKKSGQCMQSGLITSLTPPPPSTEGDRPDRVIHFILRDA